MIIPSVLAGSPEAYEKVMDHLSSLHTTLHIDVMDDTLVKGQSCHWEFMFPQGDHEVHLMVDNPMEYMSHIQQAKVVIIHAEIEHVSSIILQLKTMGKVVGLAINPETPIDDVFGLIPQVDRVLVMCVHPGRYGAEFIDMGKKIKMIKRLRNIPVEVDGGITPETISMVAQADLFVSGSYIQNHEAREAIEQLEKKRDLFGKHSAT